MPLTTQHEAAADLLALMALSKPQGPASERGSPAPPAPQSTPLQPKHLRKPRSKSSTPATLSQSPRAYLIKSEQRRRHSSLTGSRPKIEGGPAAGAVKAKPLSTQSPLALAAATAVTSERLARLLSAQGPLPIRHITAHLGQTIPGFRDLSLSKQRRLIIAVLEQGDPTNGIVFDKVSWGRWSVVGGSKQSGLHHSDSSVASKGSSPASFKRSAVQRIKDTDKDRRDSISQRLQRPNLPLSPNLAPEFAVEDVELDSADLYRAIMSDSEDDPHTDEEDWQLMGPASDRERRERDAVAALVELASV